MLELRASPGKQTMLVRGGEVNALQTDGGRARFTEPRVAAISPLLPMLSFA